MGGLSRKLLCAVTGSTAGLESKVFESVAKGYAGQKTAFCFEENLEPAGVRQLAEKIAAVTQLAGVFSQRDGKYNLCLAGKPEDVKALGAKPLFLPMTVLNGTWVIPVP